MCLSCKWVLHSYITPTDIKLCFLITSNPQQLIIARLQGVLGIVGCFFNSSQRQRSEGAIFIWGLWFTPVHTGSCTSFIKPRPQSVPVFGHNLKTQPQKNKGVFPKICKVLRGNHLNYAEEKYTRLELRFCVRASACTWALRYLGNKLWEHRLVRMWKLGELAIS